MEFISGKEIELSPEQIKKIQWYLDNPPQYYKWFYKFYKKFLAIFIVLSIVFGGSLIATIGDQAFSIVKIIFFIVFGIGIWSLSAFLYKHFYTKSYAKKIGLTLKEWNKVTIGYF